MSKLFKEQPRWFSWTSKWAEIKLWFFRNILWKIRPIKRVEPRAGVRIVTRCGKCGKVVRVRDVHWPEYTENFFPTDELILKDLRNEKFEADGVKW